MAVNALLYHKDINLREKIDFLGQEPNWKNISARLFTAVQNPNMTFHGSAEIQSTGQKPGRRKGKQLKW